MLRTRRLLVVGLCCAGVTVALAAPPTATAQPVSAQPVSAQPVSAQPVYRLYYPFTDQHLQTVDPREASVLTTLVVLDGVRFVWQVERPTFDAYPSVGGGCATGLEPVYRLYSSDGDHLLTADPNERATLTRPGQSGWTAEGVAFCADRVEGASTVPVYRILRADGREHFLTGDRQEWSRLVNVGWGGSEGVAFYAPAP